MSNLTNDEDHLNQPRGQPQNHTAHTQIQSRTDHDELKMTPSNRFSQESSDRKRLKT